MSLPKGLARKLIPKFIGPYRVVQDYGNSSFKLNLPASLKRRGIHDVFHASLLRAHEPNDDRLFPGCLASQVADLDDKEDEWAVDCVTGHRGLGKHAVFEIIWKSGDRTWVPYSSIAQTDALAAYLEAMGVAAVEELTEVNVTMPDDLQIFVGSIELVAGLRRAREDIKSSCTRDSGQVSPRVRVQPCITHLLQLPIDFTISPSSLLPSAMPNLAAAHTYFSHFLDFSGAQLVIEVAEGVEIIRTYRTDELKRFETLNSLLGNAKFIPKREHADKEYVEFATGFNRDKHCEYGFNLLDLDTLQVTRTRKRPILLQFLLPMTAIEAERDVFQTHMRTCIAGQERKAEEQYAHRTRMRAWKTQFKVTAGDTAIAGSAGAAQTEKVHASAKRARAKAKNTARTNPTNNMAVDVHVLAPALPITPAVVVAPAVTAPAATGPALVVTPPPTPAAVPAVAAAAAATVTLDMAQVVDQVMTEFGGEQAVDEHGLLGYGDDGQWMADLAALPGAGAAPV